MIELVAAGGIDLGLCYNPVTHPKLEALPVFEEPLLLAVRKGHPVLSLRGERRLERLRALDRALPAPAYGIDLSEVFPDFARYRLPTSGSYTIDAYDDAAHYTRTTDAWSLLPETFVRAFGLRSAGPSPWRLKIALKALRLKSQRMHPVCQELLAGILAKSSRAEETR